MMSASPTTDGLRVETAAFRSDLLAFERRFTRRFLMMLVAHNLIVGAAIVLG